MNNSAFTTRDIVKYFIIAGIVYTILKVIFDKAKNNTENFIANKPYSSCHGSKPASEDNTCYTCDAAIAAYNAKNWAYNEKDFPQCNTRCYGAKPIDDCYTCDDAINAYKAKGWAYNAADFKQCNKPVVTPVVTPVVQPVNSYTCDNARADNKDKDYPQCNK